MATLFLYFVFRFRESSPHPASTGPNGAGYNRTLSRKLLMGLTVILKVLRGGCSGYFAHQDGYLWEVAHNPLFWLGPKDEDV